MKFHAVIYKATGKMELLSREDLAKFVDSLSRDDQDVHLIVEIKKRIKTRTLSQNAYYRALLRIVLKFMQENGEPPEDFDTDDLHHFFCMMFHHYEIVNEETGEVSRFPRKTRNISTEEFGKIIEHVKRWTVEHLGLHLPEAGEEMKLFNMEDC